MKKIIYLLVLFPILAIGQTQSENYVKSTTYKQPTTTTISSPDINTASVGVTYFDGLGRPIQKIDNKQSATGKNIVTHIEYDEFGRQVKEFLPFASSGTTLNFLSSAQSDQLQFYNTQAFENTANPYSEKQFEPSPLNRVLKQAAPGTSWMMDSGHEIKFDYQLNSNNDQVVKFGSASNTLTCSGYYPANTLYKTVTKNENWESGTDNTTEEYKDNNGRVVLKRVYNSERFDTYYVYDAIGNLMFVIPPATADNIVQVQTDNIPYLYNQSQTLQDFLINSNGTPISGGGGLTIHIENSTISLSFSGGWSGNAKIDLTKEFEINAISPIPDMTLGYVDFYYNGNHQYIAVIQDNKLKFLDYTPSTPPFEFTSFIAQNIHQALNSSLFATVPSYSYTLNTTLLDDQCYQYKYDERNRQVEKKIPGKQWEYIVYDKLDRVVATAPAFNPFTGSQVGWMITKYDIFGRVAYTGWKQASSISSQVRETYQSDYNHDNLVLYETKVNSTVDAVAIGYSNQVTPTTGMKLLTVNYYDDYSFPNAPSTTTGSVYSEPFLQNVKGLATGSWVRVLTNNPEEVLAEKSYTFYDKKSRAIQAYKSNYLGGYTRVDSQYDFSGQLLKTDTKHNRTSSTTAITTLEQYEYTPQGRLLNHLHQVNGGAIELIAHNTYDELGKLTSKNVGGQDLANFTGLQKVDYQYNIRGWLKAINDVNTLAKTSEPLDLFAFKLNYDDVQDDEDGHVSRLFNGNISETFWRTSSDNVLRKYGYQYDALNRLSNSYYQKPDYSEPRTNGYNENLSYDKNGNITSLQRYGTLDVDGQTPPILIDNLQYVYDHTTQKVNQLVKVTDDTNNPNGFKDDGDGTNDADDDYAYDSNGNMISDQNKGITSITYNHLNLPIQINFGANGTITYLYNATGQKVRKRVQDATTGTTIETTTDYLDGYQYKDEELQFFPHSEGYVNYFKEHFYYVYNYTDHLGNIRLTYSKDPSTGVLKIIEENHYYPFGLKHGSYNTGKEAYTKEGELLKIKPVLPLFATSYAYKYNSKEFQDELGLNMYDYGARNYDPALGRWMNVDPLAEKFYPVSPYVYAINNPVYFIDPDGMEVVEHENGTTYTGTDAQNLFRSLVAQMGGATNNSESSDEEPPVDLFGKSEPKGSAFHQVPKGFKFTEGDGIFSVFGHANSGGIEYWDEQGNKQFARTAEEFDVMMSQKSEAWKQARKDGKFITLTFYACNVASEEYDSHSGQRITREDTFAEKVSTLPGVTVIAPDGYVNYGWRNGQAQITKITNFRNDGGFLTFRNGKQIGVKTDLKTALIMSQITATLKR